MRCVLTGFTADNRSRLGTEWTPLNFVAADPPLIIQPSTIYYRHIGQVPNYSGHIPGEIFRFGRTYGNDTKDAKRWLRGDYTF
ncbi:PREDICTED: protein FAM166B [Nicrophorus vespilloides]|uniref:Protein FAM166B n=1 Tax=Nicrophorus vespilloides TaxID=110193 RepID=A0ABM1M5R7_NICVS|nr:PREDICTED: protein FAM166B [Nicrophorus vespilloides]